MSVRVRFAPSPTGHLHIGGLRSALFNWYFARHLGGAFVLRIEDTDVVRSKPEFTQSILDSFAWCGMTPDEPLVYQSDRLELYRAVADELVARGAAYRCYCTPQELTDRLKSAALGDNGARELVQEYMMYDGLCWGKPERNDVPFVIRCRVPRDQESVVVEDLIRGPISFKLDTIDDFIIIRSDRGPMYNFAVVVDDAAMRISHVIRGEEHLVNTPRQMILYSLCGYRLPLFAHLPLILGPDGTKLSKRTNSVSVLEYQRQGFLPDALCNYLIRLGWSSGDQEIFTRDELVQQFTLKGVGVAGAIFDPAKLLWMNTVYLKKAQLQELLTALAPFLDDQLTTARRSVPTLTDWSDQKKCAIVALYRERVGTLCELADRLREIVTVSDEQLRTYARTLSPNQGKALDLLVHSLSESVSAAQCDRHMVERAVKQVCREVGIPLPELAQPIRYSITGSLSAPSIYDLVDAFGYSETLARLAVIAAELRNV